MVPVKYPSRRTQKYAAICSYEGSPPLVLVDSKSEIKEGTAHAMANILYCAISIFVFIRNITGNIFLA